MEFKELKHQSNSKLDRIQFIFGDNVLTFGKSDGLGEVLMIYNSEWNHLTQDNIKQLIDHLQKQLK